MTVFDDVPAAVVDAVRTLAMLVALLASLWVPAKLAAAAAVASGNAWLTSGVEGKVLFVVAASVGLATLYGTVSLYYYVSERART